MGGLAGTASREVVLAVAVSVVLVVVVLGVVESPGEMELSMFPGGGYQWVGRWWVVTGNASRETVSVPAVVPVVVVVGV